MKKLRFIDRFPDTHILLISFFLVSFCIISIFYLLIQNNKTNISSIHSLNSAENQNPTENKNSTSQQQEYISKSATVDNANDIRSPLNQLVSPSTEVSLEQIKTSASHFNHTRASTKPQGQEIINNIFSEFYGSIE